MRLVRVSLERVDIPDTAYPLPASTYLRLCCMNREK